MLSPESTPWQARLDKLNQQKDSLKRLNEIVPWEQFRPILERRRDKTPKSKAGRKPYDSVLMFKCLILQQLHNISDEELEYQINDRLSWMQFLGLGLEDAVPDRTSFWLFKQGLSKYKLMEELFEKFESYLQGNGYQAKGGQMVDATMIPVPIQHNSPEENELIKEGKIPEQWSSKKSKLSQKDRDARWTKKGEKSYYGYKNHVSSDVEYGFIRRYAVTDASVHDSQVLGKLLDDNNSENGLWGDSAYRSENIEEVLKLLNFESQIHERAYRNRPLTSEQKERNREKSKIRAKVEHIFAFLSLMGGKLVRSIGKERVSLHLGLKNLTYNFQRLVFWESRRVNCL